MTPGVNMVGRHIFWIFIAVGGGNCERQAGRAVIQMGTASIERTWFDNMAVTISISGKADVVGRIYR